MNIKEYLNIPDEVNVTLRTVVFWDNTDLPYPTDCTSLYENSTAKCLKIKDTSNVTNAQKMFFQCNSLEYINKFDTSNVGNFLQTFQSCRALKFIPELNTSKATSTDSMFNSCESIKTIPPIDTSNVTNMANMFNGCKKLIYLPELDTSKNTRMNGFLQCYGGIQTLKSLPKFKCGNVTNMSGFFYYSKVDMPNLTDVGGFEDLKCNWNDNSGLVCLSNLTYQSCINVLNGLYDFTGNGETPTSSQGKLKVHQNFLDTVGEKIDIANEKGWVVSAT